MSFPKTFEEFMGTLALENPPPSWPLELQSLWWDANANWKESHKIAQELTNEIGNWIHAYLHRKEGDKFNAGYWYRQANKPYSSLTFKEEFEEMVIFVINYQNQ
ncbi:MAG: hypothetical protein HKP24_13025 [Croceitalea sp.]|nr:hypothetical protein [Croceitalea sp.]NNM19480.1 hypothetical protein [Croceitalea sp.]